MPPRAIPPDAGPPKAAPPQGTPKEVDDLLIAEHGTSWILPRLLGAGRALDLLWSSRKVGADEALRIGLVEDVVPPDDLLARARRWIVELAEVASPASRRDTKRLVYDHLGVGYPDALRQADRAQWEAIARPDAAEGAASLIERRPPHFGRLGDGRPQDGRASDEGAS